MPVTYAFNKEGAIVGLHDTIEPASLAIVQKMLNAGEVRDISLGNIDLETLSSLDLANIRSINISGIPCYDLGFLASIKKLESLRLSYVAQPRIGKGIRLDTIPSIDTLRSLALFGVKGLNNLPPFPNLKSLNLGGINENLGFIRGYPGLKDLWISDSVEGLHHVLYCKNLARLCMIQVRKVDFAGILADGTVNTSLKILEISHCPDLVSFDFLKQFPSLKYMDISSSRNIASFEGIENCKNLEVICVSECRVRDKNLKYLLHIDNVQVGMIYKKQEITDFAKQFKGKVYYISRAEKGDFNYGDFYTKHYGGNIDDIAGI